MATVSSVAYLSYMASSDSAQVPSCDSGYGFSSSSSSSSLPIPIPSPSSAAVAAAAAPTAVAANDLKTEFFISPRSGCRQKEEAASRE